MKKPYKGTRTSSWKKEDKHAGGKKFGGGGAWKRGGDHKVEGARSTRPGMHDATCGKCGKACQVPFRPTGERPIFCSTCFANGSGPAKFTAEGGRPSSIFVGQQDTASTGGGAKIEARLKAIEDKLDALIEALTEDLDEDEDDEDEEEDGEKEGKA